LEYGRDCTLRSCVRLRAASKVEREHNLVNGSFRFEAIVPDYSFQAVKIRNLPILSTPLSVNLTRQNGDEARELGPRMGYLTMNQTRKIVPLLETDTASAMTPMVGVWLSVDDCDTGTDIATDFMKHPFVWGACVRFLKNKKVHDRAFVDENTFLLVNFGQLSISFYEMTCMSPHAQAGNGEGDDFICCDFSVDLSMDTSKSNEANLEPIVCKFRPLSQVDRIKSFREATGRQGDNRGKMTNMTLPGQSVSASVNYASMTTDQLSEITKKLLSEATANLSESNTPLPRDSKEIINMRNSVESSGALTGIRSGDPRYEVQLNTNGGDSVLVTNPATEPARGNAGASSSLANLSTGALPPSTSVSNAPSFPAEVVLAQQMQIDALRQQVFDLQSQIQTMNQLMVRSIDLGSAVVAANEVRLDGKLVESSLTSEKDEKTANSDLKEAILSEAKMEHKDATQNELIDRDDNIDQVLVQVAGEEALRPMQVITVESDEYSLLSAAEEESIKAIRSSYSRINPLNSAALNHPVLRLNSETEADLMEPSILSQKLVGGSAFPAPSVEYDDDDLIVDDDEEKLKELDSISEAANAPMSTSGKKGTNASSKKKTSTTDGTRNTASRVNELVVASQEIIVPRSINADESEGTSALETDSILAIQNRYL
jgi:hypothetical protein